MRINIDRINIRVRNLSEDYTRELVNGFGESLIHHISKNMGDTNGSGTHLIERIDIERIEKGDHVSPGELRRTIITSIGERLRSHQMNGSQR